MFIAREPERFALETQSFGQLDPKSNDYIISFAISFPEACLRG